MASLRPHPRARSMPLHRAPAVVSDVGQPSTRTKSMPVKSAPVTAAKNSSGGGEPTPPKSVKQQQTVVAVFPHTKSGDKAFESLQSAVNELKHTELERIPFEKLDFGEMAALDAFYAANVVVVDATERTMQAPLFYQLGLRENFDMKNNVVAMQEKDAGGARPGIAVDGSGSDVERGVPASAVSAHA